MKATVGSGAKISLLSLKLRISQGVSLGDFQLAPACPIEKVTLWVGFLYLTAGIRNRRGCRERQSFCPNWESNPGLRVQNPVRYPLGYRFTLLSGDALAATTENRLSVLVCVHY